MSIKPRLVTMTVLLVLAVVGTAPAQSRNDADSHARASAKSTNNSNSGTKATKNGSNYIIGTDDVLGINVWKEPEFGKSVPVLSDGNISLPLIGEVKAAGKTPTQLQEDITAKLSAYFKQPEVTVMVVQTNSRKYNILGRVRKPGSYSLAATKTVLDAIAEAGGFQDFAKVKKIYILRRKADGQQIRLPFNYKEVIQGKHVDENVTLKPHDTIIVP